MNISAINIYPPWGLVASVQSSLDENDYQDHNHPVWDFSRQRESPPKLLSLKL